LIELPVTTAFLTLLCGLRISFAPLRELKRGIKNVSRKGAKKIARRQAIN
jgi:hypothetical protein